MDFSHYPAIPTALDAELTTLGEEPCPYLPERRSRYRAFTSEWVPPDFYHRLMDAGFRRSGEFFYQPACRGCRACVPIRVPVASFCLSRSQRRVERLNEDLEVTIATPSFTPEKFELYQRYARDWHGREERDQAAFESFLVNSPVDSVEFTYREPGGRLVASGLCDVCAASVSSVYFYFDPNEARRSLGTYGALVEITWAAGRGIPHYYLGYWVAGCGAMAYKNKFRPCELLGTDGMWRSAGC